MYAYPEPLSGRSPSRRPVRVWDVVVTIVLLVLLLVEAMFVSFFGAFLAMASDPCGASVACNTDLIGLGVVFAMGAPWILLLLAAAIAIVLLVRRRVAFWVPLVGGVLVVASWFVGATIATAGVPT